MRPGDPAIAEAARLLREARCAIAVTGAGISVESGIPDFRSADGLWARFPPEDYATLDAFRAHPDKVWRLFHEIGASFGAVAPNAGHAALAALERAGRLHAVITQNIDNLHQAAGSAEVVEYHGNTARVVCLDCGAHRPMARPEPGPGAPRCACGAAMKPDVVLFGETIPPKAMLRAAMWAQRADVVLVVGTSAQVYPAAGLPGQAKLHGARVIECNIAPTEFTGTLTDVFLEGAAGRLLPELAAAVLES
jgi:NAD-dependent deacetylase